MHQTNSLIGYKDKSAKIINGDTMLLV